MIITCCAVFLLTRIHETYSSSFLSQKHDLITLVNLALLTGRVKDGKRISMLLVADTESGKTQILEVFMNLKTVIWANDLSAHVIVDEIAPQIERGKTHILIPDLLKVLSHQKVVSKNTMTMLNSIMEEGLKNIMFYGSRKEFHRPVRCGVIAAITKSGYEAREPYWKSIGFVGRCIPVSFSYSEETIRKISVATNVLESMTMGDKNTTMIANARSRPRTTLLDIGSHGVFPFVC